MYYNIIEQPIVTYSYLHVVSTSQSIMKHFLTGALATVTIKNLA